MRQPLLVVSPHLDDAVMACGQWLAAEPGALVLTVFAGMPASGGPTPWDADCGFEDSREAIRARWAEDDAALAELEAQPLRLPFRDAQYGHPPNVAKLAGALVMAFSRWHPHTIVFPLGLFHSDHVLARRAVLEALRQLPRLPVLAAYEDALYRGLPDELQFALAALRRQGYRAGEAIVRDDTLAAARKRRAVAHYTSQVRGLAGPGRLGHESAFGPETYWPIEPPRRSARVGPRASRGAD